MAATPSLLSPYLGQDPGLHPFHGRFLLDPLVIMPQQMEDPVGQQRGQLPLDGMAPLGRLALRLRIGDYDLAQGWLLSRG